jgi:hypothetical protein
MREHLRQKSGPFETTITGAGNISVNPIDASDLLPFSI